MKDRALLPEEAREVFEDTMKYAILTVGTKCDIHFDLAKIEKTLTQKGCNLNRQSIRAIIVRYCETLESKNERILEMSISDLELSILSVTFTMALFDKNELPVVDTSRLNKVVVSCGEWRNGTGKMIPRRTTN